MAPLPTHAVVLSVPSFQKSSGHLLLAMVTSTRQSQWPLDWSIQNRESAGLPHPCLVRFKLFTLDERLVLNMHGELTGEDRDGMMELLRRFLGAFP